MMDTTTSDSFKVGDIVCKEQKGKIIRTKKPFGTYTVYKEQLFETGTVKTVGKHQLKGLVDEGNVLFNDTLNTLLISLYGVRHMVNYHSYSEKGNLLPSLHGLLFLISSKGSFICTNP